MNFKTKITRVF